MSSEEVLLYKEWWGVIEKEPAKVLYLVARDLYL